MNRRNFFRSLAAVTLASAIDLGVCITPPRRKFVINEAWLYAPYESVVLIHDAMTLRFVGEDKPPLSEVELGHVLFQKVTEDTTPLLAHPLFHPGNRFDAELNTVPKYVEVFA